ncbi:IMPACT family protein [Dietzia maris]|uniref:IMPACT family protein n=1 Tax=Dietzia TaxID=37914 RepID=UPI0022B4F098|nr:MULTISPECIES: YigZ family protein [Dietzia]MCZ4539735.1 YigZ family protein [Dietzia maris]MCZ4656828.1 YigZ family protein [Dietzia kunjamensis]MDV3355797.1 YigZ family protein [Dietzia sp. IN118]
MTDSPPRVLRLTAGPDVTGEYEEKRSRFVAVLRRCDDEEDARALIAELRAAHPSARHHCSGFIVDVPGASRIERSSDDGEPSGTAGTPMLDVLRGSGLTGVCAVVVRWFGGTKLGTGGLARAYSAAVSEAVDAAWRDGRVAEVTRTPAWTAEVDHSVAGGLEGALRSAGARVMDVDYGRRVRLTVVGELDVVGPILAARTSGGVEWETAGVATTENAAVRRDMES